MKTKPNLTALDAALKKLDQIDQSGLPKGTTTAADLVTEALPMIKAALEKGYTIATVATFLEREGAGISAATLKGHISRALNAKSRKKKLTGDLNIVRGNRGEREERQERQERQERNDGDRSE